MGAILDFGKWRKLHEAEMMQTTGANPMDPQTLKQKLLAVKNDADYYALKNSMGAASIKSILAKLSDLSDEDRNAIASNLLFKTSEKLSSQLKPALDEFKSPSFIEKVGNWMKDEPKTVNTVGDTF